VKELRHPDDVSLAESLASFRAAPVTDDHPGMVGPENVSDVSIGLVSETVKFSDKGLVQGEIIVQRKDAIEEVQSGRLKEISPGYTCSIDPTPGVWQGEHYDQAQKEIIYNHVALGPVGWGRSGPEVALRMDAAVSGADKIKGPEKGKERIEMTKLRPTLDGVTYELEIADPLVSTFEASISKLEQAVVEANESVAKAEGSRVAAEKRADELQQKFDAAIAPEAIEAMVQERTETLDKARQLAPEAKFDGLSLTDIRKEALAIVGYARETLDSRDEAFIAGVFEGTKIPESASSATDYPRITAEPIDRTDASDLPNADEAFKRMCERNRTMWDTKN
jgi:hypothetical protein